GLPTLELPTDRPRPAVARYRGAVEVFDVPESVIEGLRALAREERATLFMALLGAFAVLLGRFSRQRDVAVGTPVAGRDRREMEGLIGFFVNTVVIRTDLSAEPTFRSLLGEVRATVLDAFAHQELPFDKLVEAVHPERELSRSPLFQVVFAMQNLVHRADVLEMPGLVLSFEESDTGTAKFDLTMLI